MPTTAEMNKAQLVLLRKARSYVRSAAKLVDGMVLANEDRSLTNDQMLASFARTLDWIDEAIWLLEAEGGDEDAGTNTGADAGEDHWPGS